MIRLYRGRTDPKVDIGVVAEGPLGEVLVALARAGGDTNVNNSEIKHVSHSTDQNTYIFIAM